MTRERLWKQIQENKTIKQLENENADLKHSLDWANEREHDDYVKIQELEKEKCELLGIIQEKDKLIEEMKCCERRENETVQGL